jgi:rRNA-processing protein EBP2
MVTKSKLKMALLAEKGVDFKKLKQKKLAKKAKKELKSKKSADEWEDIEESDDGEDGAVELEGEDSGDDRPAQVCCYVHKISVPSWLLQIDFAGIDDSDSDSSGGVEDSNGLQDADEAEAEEEEDEEEDEEDIPISDLEDLEDEDKEDIIPHQRLTINNTIALTSALKRIALPLSTFAFSEHQSLTTSAPVSIPDVSDDLNRELAFYAQSLSAVKEARALLKAEGAPFSRPKDYFAEMVKADEHMTKIKAKLVEEAASKKAAAEARKQRDLKKFGKQVQVAKLQEREKERKQTMEKIKVLKRSKSFPIMLGCYLLSLCCADCVQQSAKTALPPTPQLKKQTSLTSRSMIRFPNLTRGVTSDVREEAPINARRRTKSSGLVGRSAFRRAVMRLAVVI